MKSEIPAEIMEKQLSLVEKIKGSGKIKAGINEVTKAVEREKAKLVLIAQDVQPKEIVMHLPLLCKEKKIPYSFVPEKKELGKRAGLNVATASIAIIDEGNAKKELIELVKKIEELNK